MGIIYKATNKITDKCYIGQTIYRLCERKKSHKFAALVKKIDTLFYNSIRKHGWNNFKWEILEECDDNKINKREKYYIKKYNSFLEDGYNLTEGGERNYKLSKETRKKISKSKKGQPSTFLGKSHTEEAKEKNRQAHLGKQISEETRKKISKASSGRKHTEESKKKMSIIQQKVQKGKKLSKEHKKAIGNGVRGLKRTKENKQNLAKAKSVIRWFVTTPEGKSFHLYNLKKFCRENNLNMPELSSKGKTKGYKAYRDIKI